MLVLFIYNFIVGIKVIISYGVDSIAPETNFTDHFSSITMVSQIILINRTVFLGMIGLMFL